jgi:hypothetical protein
MLREHAARKEQTVGFLDKAKQLAQQAETQLNQATGQMGGAQNTKVADTWLKELGQWVYADRMGRDPRAAAEIEVRIQQLQQWEQQNGTQVPMPFASPGTSPGGTTPASAPGAPIAPAAAAPIPGTLSDAPPAAAAPIPGTLSGPAAGGDPAAMPSPGGSLGPLDPPVTGPLTVPPAPPPPAPPAPPEPPTATEPPEPPAAPSPPGPPSDLPSPPS